MWPGLFFLFVIGVEKPNDKKKKGLAMRDYTVTQAVVFIGMFSDSLLLIGVPNILSHIYLFLQCCYLIFKKETVPSHTTTGLSH